jgi:hypothetical protein
MPVFEWYMARLVVENRCVMKRMYRAQNRDTILGSVVNTIGRGFVIAERERITFTLTSNNFCISTPINT